MTNLWIGSPRRPCREQELLSIQTGDFHPSLDTRGGRLLAWAVDVAKTATGRFPEHTPRQLHPSLRHFDRRISAGRFALDNENLHRPALGWHDPGIVDAPSGLRTRGRFRSEQGFADLCIIGCRFVPSDPSQLRLWMGQSN